MLISTSVTTNVILENTLASARWNRNVDYIFAENKVILSEKQKIVKLYQRINLSKYLR